MQPQTSRMWECALWEGPGSVHSRALDEEDAGPTSGPAQQGGPRWGRGQLRPFSPPPLCS